MVINKSQWQIEKLASSLKASFRTEGLESKTKEISKLITRLLELSRIILENVLLDKELKTKLKEINKLITRCPELMRKPISAIIHHILQIGICKWWSQVKTLLMQLWGSRLQNNAKMTIMSWSQLIDDNNACILSTLDVKCES